MSTKKKQQFYVVKKVDNDFSWAEGEWGKNIWYAVYKKRFWLWRILNEGDSLMAYFYSEQAALRAIENYERGPE